MTKATRQRRHAMQRARERYDLVLDGDLYRRIVSMIRSGRSTPLERQSNRIVVHGIQLDEGGLLIPVVYDKTRGEIVTFLPQDWEGLQQLR